MGCLRTYLKKACMLLILFLACVDFLNCFAFEFLLLCFLICILVLDGCEFYWVKILGDSWGLIFCLFLEVVLD